jgi:hypothetical protein
MKTLKNTKFWIALGVLVMHIGMFLTILFLKPELMTVTTISLFIAGVTADLATFGTLNVIASGQPVQDPPKAAQ